MTQVNLRTEVYVSPTRVIAGDRTFSPVSSTLFTAGDEAVLVDAQYYGEDVAALGDMIERSGKRLTTIYVTHGHSDHYFGAGEIAARFPGSRVVSLPSVIKYIDANHEGEVKNMIAMFGDRAVQPTVLPQPMEGNLLEVGGIPLLAIEIGQGDINPSTALRAPDQGVIVPGDIVYNGIHMMLGLTDPEQWQAWSASVDAIERLKPAKLVAGHKRPELSDDEPQRILDETRGYIRDFAETAAADPTADAIIAAMQMKYPDFGNQTTLVFSAHAAARRLTGRAPPRIT